MQKRGASNDITAVSIYFEQKKSKHSVGKYDKWIKTMSQSVSSAPLAIVVNYKGYMKLKEFRSEKLTKFYVVPSIWSQAIFFYEISLKSTRILLLKICRIWNKISNCFKINFEVFILFHMIT